MESPSVPPGCTHLPSIYQRCATTPRLAATEPSIIAFPCRMEIGVGRGEKTPFNGVLPPISPTTYVPFVRPAIRPFRSVCLSPRPETSSQFKAVYLNLFKWI